MSLYQVGPFDLFIAVTDSGFEIKTRKLNKKNNQFVYTGIAYYSKLENVFKCLVQLVLEIKANAQKEGNLTNFEADYDAALELIEKLRSKYAPPLTAEREKKTRKA
jgi:hypothetical protein